RARLGGAIEARTRAHSLGEGALRSAADHGPVGEGIREREADLDEIGAVLDGCRCELGSRPARHQVDDERLHPVPGATTAKAYEEVLAISRLELMRRGGTRACARRRRSRPALL